MARSQIRGVTFPVPARPSEGQQKKGKELAKELRRNWGFRWLFQNSGSHSWMKRTRVGNKEKKLLHFTNLALYSFT
jgi:hypothetical protein